MLALSEITRYLLDKDLIESRAVLDGDLMVVDVSSRNQNCAVTCREGPTYFLKQDVSSLDSRQDNTGPSLIHEAAVYALIASLPSRRGPDRVDHLLPRFIGYDETEGMLLLELLDGARDLTSHHSRTGRFSTTLARGLGRALADLHTAAVGPARQDGRFSGRIPWVLSLDRPGTALWREASNAGLQLVQIIQSAPTLRQALAELRAGWQLDAFVHHDLKWDNCLVLASGGSGRRVRVALVDWEFADLGDACWDVGAVFGNYLSFWLASIPVTGTEPPDHYLDLARYPLDRMQPAMKAFWSGYADARGWDRGAAHAALVKSVRYAGARLLQSAYEQTVRMSRLDGNSICLLQLALNVMDRPSEAANHLLGIVEAGAR